MILSSHGYNIPTVTISNTVSIDAETKVGTVEDFDTVLGCIKNSGLAFVDMMLGSQRMKGFVVCSPYADDDGIEFHTISSAGANEPYVVFGNFVPKPDGSYVTVKIVSLS